MTRNELIAAAILALEDDRVSTYVDTDQDDTDQDIVDGILSEVVEIVVDTVLRAQGG